ncbi:response regulator transcription factor [Candidatus Methylacidithermus pantelleriae]|uniref:Putative Transcriptional activator protein CopR n=1 Tax=Candidatus Methylacidithermus pantelleriae TaxID=2744239 RepID=A0A8J2BPJ8_9BACT|nr:response regulator transcription factor [Candidatus Methylacidithermus pantelleriae]CAF0699150.1 putative Transcriptional activator protein CopR [Candidatus Methylacidithermus pantelleriae]
MNHSPFVLVAARRPIIRRLQKRFSQKGWHLVTVSTAEELLRFFEDHPVDCILVEQNLPDRSGIEVIRHIRGRTDEVLCILLLEKASPRQRIKALQQGADDLFCRPWSTEELVLRIDSLLRRTIRTSSPIRVIDDLRIDWHERRCWRGSQEIVLTPKEFLILSFLAERAGQVVSTDLLAAHAWRFSRSHRSLRRLVHVHMVNLRKKIDAGHPVPLLHTIRGQGFLLGKLGSSPGKQ